MPKRRIVNSFAQRNFTVYVLLCVLLNTTLAGAAWNKIQLESVSLNYAGAVQAISLWDHEAGEEVTAPEWAATDNLLQNPNVELGVEGWNSNGTPSIGEEEGNNLFVLDMEGSDFHQDIDLAEFTDLINESLVSVTISGDLKAQSIDVLEGFPYLYGYLIGTEAEPERINTYMTSNAIKEEAWTYVSINYPVPPFTQKIRLFLNRSSVRNVDDENTAYFDNLSVKIKYPKAPAAYPKDAEFTVQAQFKATSSINEALIWAEGSLGGLNSSAVPQLVVFDEVLGENYKIGEGIFAVNSPSGVINKLTTEWNWKYKIPAESSTKEICKSKHKLYVTFDVPKNPMTMPWVDVLDYACQWAQGENDLTDISTTVRNGLNIIEDTDGDLDYNPSAFYCGGFAAGSYILLLSDFLEDLKTTNDVQINCYDCSHLLAVFLTSLGVDATNVLLGTPIPIPSGCDSPYEGCYIFRTNYIDAIGNGSNDPADSLENWGTTKWTSHVIITVNDKVFDSCLNGDGDGNAASLPCLLHGPTDMPMNDYKQLLINNLPAEGPCFPYCIISEVYDHSVNRCLVQ